MPVFNFQFLPQNIIDLHNQRYNDQINADVPSSLFTQTEVNFYGLPLENAPPTNLQKWTLPDTNINSAVTPPKYIQQSQQSSGYIQYDPQLSRADILPAVKTDSNLMASKKPSCNNQGRLELHEP